MWWQGQPVATAPRIATGSGVGNALTRAREDGRHGSSGREGKTRGPCRAIALLFASAALSLPASVPAADSNVVGEIQQTLDDFLAQRHEIEGVSAISLHVDLGDPGPVIEAYSGNDGLRDNAPIDGDTLFQIGSNTKHFEAAVLLRLEADGKLDITQTVGDWLPQYPAWSHVKIRQLLNMTSAIPNYSETVAIGRIVASDLGHQFTNRELIKAAYPAAKCLIGGALPPHSASSRSDPYIDPPGLS